MPQKYSGLGISFLYPDGWRLDEEPTDSEEGQGVTIESPNGAFMAINRFSRIETETAVQSACEAMVVEYDEIESEQITRRLGTQELEVTMQRFYYLDLVIASQLLAFTNAEYTYLVQVQGEDREIDELQLVFDAMLISVFQSLAVT